ncbi:MAG: hypothetical protein ACXVX8_16170 [Blastococcus sp.]
MTITWGRLRRRNDMNEQVAGIGAEEHGSPASDKRRARQEKRLERQKIQQEVRREFSGGDPRSPEAWGSGGGDLAGWGGF